MSKYDFPLDLSDNTSTGTILKKIRPGSTVLEFGCAEGRMTKYMSEQLGCQVYIAEYDQEAYQRAIQYARDGVCDDILSYSWKEKFNTLRFDYILFVDVLEHLSAPAEVMKTSAELIKKDGQILVSIPNVTHNDILLKASQEHWDYTSTGLLDDTHVHFWGYQNLQGLAKDAGLHLALIEATYCSTGMTEQKPLFTGPQEMALRSCLSQRKCGEVYQFILTFDQNDSGRTDENLRAPGLESHLYFEDDDGFTDRNVSAIRAEFTDIGTLKVDYSYLCPRGTGRLRFDPLEEQPCVIESFSAVQNGRSCRITFSDVIIDGSRIFLLSDDPQILIDQLIPEHEIHIKAEFSFLSSRDFRRLLLLQRDQESKLERELNDLNQKQAKIAALQEEVRKENEQKEILQKSLSEAENKLNKASSELIETSRHLRQSQQDNEKLVSQKTQYLSELDIFMKTVTQKEEAILELEEGLEECRSIPGVKTVVKLKKAIRKHKS